MARFNDLPPELKMMIVYHLPLYEIVSHSHVRKSDLRALCQRRFHEIQPLKRYFRVNVARQQPTDWALGNLEEQNRLVDDPDARDTLRLIEAIPGINLFVKYYRVATRFRDAPLQNAFGERHVPAQQPSDVCDLRLNDELLSQLPNLQTLDIHLDGREPDMHARMPDLKNLRRLILSYRVVEHNISKDQDKGRWLRDCNQLRWLEELEVRDMGCIYRPRIITRAHQFQYVTTLTWYVDYHKSKFGAFFFNKFLCILPNLRRFIGQNAYEKYWDDIIERLADPHCHGPVLSELRLQLGYGLQTYWMTASLASFGNLQEVELTLAYFVHRRGKERRIEVAHIVDLLPVSLRALDIWIPDSLQWNWPINWQKRDWTGMDDIFLNIHREALRASIGIFDGLVDRRPYNLPSLARIRVGMPRSSYVHMVDECRVLVAHLKELCENQLHITFGHYWRDAVRHDRHNF